MAGKEAPVKALLHEHAYMQDEVGGAALDLCGDLLQTGVVVEVVSTPTDTSALELRHTKCMLLSCCRWGQAYACEVT
jgi:hypothetical protein